MAPVEIAEDVSKLDPKALRPRVTSLRGRAKEPPQQGETNDKNLGV